MLENAGVMLLIGSGWLAALILAAAAWTLDKCRRRIAAELRDLTAQSTLHSNLLDAFLKATPVGLGFVDMNYRYLRMNDALADIDGVSVEYHLGKTVSETVPQLWPTIGPLYRRVAETGESILNFEVEGETPKQPGVRRHWQVNYYPVRLDRQIVGIGLAVVETTERSRDIRRLQETEELLRHEIAQRCQAEEELRRAHAELEQRVAAGSRELRDSQERFRNAFDHAPNGMYVCSVDGRWLKVNSELCDMVGRTEADMLATTFQAITHPDDLAADHVFVADMLAGDTTHLQIEKRYMHKDGQVVWVLLSAALVCDDEGQPLYFVGHVHDFRERKEAERRLKASLDEKEVLLREVHHRVKNNLQVISSLLHLQSQHLREPAVAEMFRESQNRVRSMALVHERLYRARDFAHVNIAEYIDSLAKHLYRSYRADSDRVTLNVNVHSIALSIDTAIPCGLLLNELVSNCLKHAFPGRERGRIAIDLVPLDGDQAVLRVQDDGVGLPESIEPRRAASFGMQLIGDLTDQLHGQISIAREGGTTFSIVFPWRQPSRLR